MGSTTGASSRPHTSSKGSINPRVIIVPQAKHEVIIIMTRLNLCQSNIGDGMNNPCRQKIPTGQSKVKKIVT